LTLFIFIRHGQADNNVNRILVGRHIESHLTHEGKSQVKDTAKYLKKMNINKVYASPVTRAVETAGIICQELKLEYQMDERLYEIELGKLVGMNYEDIINKHGNLFLKFYRENDEILYNYGVESFAEVKKRIQNLLDEMVEKYPDENLLFVTHLDPIKAVISLLLDLKPEALFKLHIRNAALTIIKQEGGMLSLSGVNIMGIQRYMDE
jgi:probable phosphoglycerate mutase